MNSEENIGKIGEKIATSFLVKHGFSILETNYRTKYGEIDIIAKKDKVFHFVEVKSMQVQDLQSIKTLKIDPKENFTKNKYEHVLGTSRIFLSSSSVTQETKQQIDLACVYIQTSSREAKVRYFENVEGGIGDSQ